MNAWKLFLFRALTIDRSRGRRSVFFVAWVKWNTSVLLCLIARPKFCKMEDSILKHVNRVVFIFLKFFSWEMNRPLSTNDRVEIEIGIVRFLLLFSQIFRIGTKYRAKRMGDRDDPCSNPIPV